MIFTRNFLHHSIGKFLVYGTVVFPVRFAKHRASMCDVAEWPKTFIGKTIVVAVFLLGAQPHAPQRIARFIRRNLQPIVAVRCFYIRIAASMSDSGPIAGTKNRFNRCD